MGLVLMLFVQFAVSQEVPSESPSWVSPLMISKLPSKHPSCLGSPFGYRFRETFRRGVSTLARSRTMAQAIPGHNPSQGFATGTGEKVGKVQEHLCPHFLQPDTQGTLVISQAGSPLWAPYHPTNKGPASPSGPELFCGLQPMFLNQMLLCPPLPLAMMVLSWPAISILPFKSPPFLTWVTLMGDLKCTWVQHQKRQNDLVLFPGKPFNITVIQVYAPTTDAEGAVDCFYENIQDLLELTPKMMSFSS